MWRPKLPEVDPDFWLPALLFGGIPFFCLITGGAPILPSLLIGLIGTGLVYLLRR